MPYRPSRRSSSWHADYDYVASVDVWPLQMGQVGASPIRTDQRETRLSVCDVASQLCCDVLYASLVGVEVVWWANPDQ
ncbi:hypothetical protein MycrhDRAFT_1041 [Mycolicibacterium rhodesiae JS60]|nr:hypothetical protein MycrhDRAFT_1041 [Mycolicibacterium rhodesiae JS60]